MFCKATTLSTSLSNAIGFSTLLPELLLGDKELASRTRYVLADFCAWLSLSGIDLSLIPRGIPFPIQPNPRRPQSPQTKQHDLATSVAALPLGSDTSGMGASSLVTAISSLLLRLRFLQDLCVVCAFLSSLLR